MSDFSLPSSNPVFEPGIEPRIVRDDQNDSMFEKIHVSNTFALMKAVVQLRFLQTTTAILRVTRTNPVSISDPNSTICRAIDRREQRITYIIDRMTKERLNRKKSNIKSQILAQHDLSLSEILETLATAEDVSRLDERFLHISSTDSATSIPKPNSLVSEDATAAAAVDGDVRSERKGSVGDENGRIPSGLSSSLPTPVSDSVYSSLGRSFSVSNVQSVSSGPRQCMVVSAAQYTKIVMEREPQYSVVSHPYSIGSLVAESTQVDRSALEINEHHQEKSADSFPGEFPASEGVEFSSLATAKHHTRISSVRTSVRPFSDL
ncbi:hypothetical protein BDW59DRAFT_5219 [Aspergillus cavernicola]|uniref:Uncharacterized protein n=1 Tax=Aspergillus cavernicola TaxID=176166 RepID=A0ABR4J5A7_9EURO